MENEEGKAFGKPLKKKPKVSEDKDPSPVVESSRPDLSSCIFDVSEYRKSLRKEPIQKKIRRKPRRSSYPCSAEEEQKMLEFYCRSSRSHNASFFTKDYKFVKGTKICISSPNFQFFTPPGEYCFDSSWVAVHGFDTICMVTCRKDMDMTRLSAYYRSCRNEKEALLDFPEAVISEVECIPYNDFGYNHEILRQLCGSNVVKPFGVVSLVLTTEKSWKKAINPVVKFLKQKMKDSCSSITDYETLQTAIVAYQQVCRGRVLRAEDILVTIMDVSSGGVNHLDIDIITEQLQIVCGCRSPTNTSETPLVLRHPKHQTRLRDSRGPMHGARL